MGQEAVVKEFFTTAADGKVTKLEAELKADQEFKKFRVTQDKTFESDFDREVKQYLKKKK